MTALVQSGSHVVEAYANWSRWVAHCGLCPRAMRLQSFTPHLECDLCGTTTEVIWPSESMVAGVERLLMMRPDPSTRNWVPGETLHALMFENGAHGIFDNLSEQLGAAPGESLFVVEDERIRMDGLPVIKHRVRKEIAA